MSSSSTLTLQPQDVSLSSPLTTPHTPPPNPNKHCNSKLFKKPWYQRTIELIVLLWKPVTSRQSSSPVTSKSTTDPHCEKPKLRKCSSLKVATSFTRVCLCAPISSYNELFQCDMPPRRSYSYPRSKSYTASDRDRDRAEKFNEGRPSVSYTQNPRKIFRGKSLSDDVLMRRFVTEEATVIQQKRRTNQMEFIRKRNAMRRKKIGLSPLGKMSIAEEELENLQINYQ
ncbi:Serine/Threonine-kinase [Rhynchospora pubera]|uniref:Serine/Threonine-kinase n=1 Tax=Rhynchospora pubera TaxID=906938 RepID=A0AAV8D5S4_9POAL|nr:Serine/Threonine-kinase [Rhynchospora pubera]KAJ4761831.1 Serine/Threonine-kinase [Rhynchospora pubera]KAJ4790472.1 Serine/Threonine-kinase [Rhynchospora pubera]KAJ4814315.1 Serine/Threonine-kinase [Rhynchospora pubera]